MRRRSLLACVAGSAALAGCEAPSQPPESDPTPDRVYLVSARIENRAHEPVVIEVTLAVDGDVLYDELVELDDESAGEPIEFATRSRAGRSS